MIWGQKYEDLKREYETQKLVFALFPKRLADGRTVWLDYVWRKWNEDQGANWAGDSSHWEYYENHQD